MTRCSALLLALSLALPSLARPDASRGDADDQAAFAWYEAELHRMVVASAPTAEATVETTAGGDAARSHCTLLTAQHATTEECTSCHGAQSHPVGVDYAGVAGQRPGSFRSAAEVVARGVFLEDGQLTCLTCHDARSPWKNRIALPPGAAARPAVDPHSYSRARLATGAHLPLQPGAAVTPTPLCRACHTVGD